MSGRYSLLMIDRNHPIGKLANFRDLGQLPAEGGKVRTGQVFRSDDLSQIDDEEANRLVDLGLALVIDLRSADEVEGVGKGPLGTHQISYVNIPLLSDESSGIQTEELLNREFTSQMLGQWYAKVFLEGVAKIGTGLEMIADSKGPVLFHCAVGKDRTGIFAASLLAAIGVKRHAIVGDYSRTNENLSRVLARLTALQPFWDESLIARSGALMRADKEAMETMLEVVGYEHEIVGKLEAAGLKPGTREKLMTRLIQS